MSELKLEINAGDQLLNFSAINREFRKIAMANNWQSYHTPKNLAAAIAVEAAELLAEFQWLTPVESTSLTVKQKLRAANEIADVVLYVSELCASLDIDVVHAVQTKIEKNQQRFIKD